ncbi:MAG: aspartate/glutamate racemase family protein [Gammaproteobacteria bacterium]|nr:aspartate/glutamate racemase family protein [Gammaproteobacteria bacterium]
MKTIGLIGGMSWESTQFYYQQINRGVRERLGGLHSAEIVMVSVDFAPIEQFQHAGDWQATADILSQAARSLEAAGADFFLICTNTMHKVAGDVTDSVSIPLLHIADATGRVLQQDGIKRVGLLGTGFTMAQPFYKHHISDNFDIEVVVPDSDGQKAVHDIIYQQLCLGDIRDSSRRIYLDVIEQLREQGCEAIILGCTEIGMLVKQSNTRVSLYDTTQIHAECAVDRALE